MIQTIVVDVINENALRLSRDLELLHLIKIHKKEIDSQLNELRNGWE